MWIRRSFGDDQLYSTLVQAYIDTLLQNGYNFECFVGMSSNVSDILVLEQYANLNRGRSIKNRQTSFSQIWDS